MTSQLLALNLCNLIIPGDPEELQVSTSLGTWKFYQNPGFIEAKRAILRDGKCANTYCIEFDIPHTHPDHADCLEATLDELLALCLGASYLTCQAVAPTQSTMTSSISFLTLGDRFPRQRGMISPNLARLIQRGQGLSVDFDRAGLSVRRRGGVGI